MLSKHWYFHRVVNRVVCILLYRDYIIIIVIRLGFPHTDITTTTYYFTTSSTTSAHFSLYTRRNCAHFHNQKQNYSERYVIVRLYNLQNTDVNVVNVHEVRTIVSRSKSNERSQWTSRLYITIAYSRIHNTNKIITHNCNNQIIITYQKFTFYNIIMVIGYRFKRLSSRLK